MCNLINIHTYCTRYDLLVLYKVRFTGTIQSIVDWYLYKVPFTGFVQVKLFSKDVQ